MTKDMYPKWWLRNVKLYLLWRDLPESGADRLINALPDVELDRLNAFLLMMQKPARALRELEILVKNDNLDYADALIDKLPRPDLEKLAKAGLGRGKLADNLSKMVIEELRELVQLCSLPKSFLVGMTFVEGLAPKTKQVLGLGK